MGRFYHALLFMLARCTRNELIRQVEFLKAENKLLRSRVGKQFVILKPHEKRRLVELGLAIGPALQHLISVVTYPTFRKWVDQATNRAPVKKRGRPATPDQVRELIVKIARETGWGYTRVLGELHKLGIYSASRQTVVNILKANGLEPGPRRGPGTWDQFLKMHAETLWQCDFFSKRVITRLGIHHAIAVAFINLATRRVWVSPCTLHPTEIWVKEQGSAFLKHVQQNDLPAVRILTRDDDVKYETSFDALFAAAGGRVRKLALRAPNTNAYVERFIQSLQVECLDHFMAFGKKRLDYLVREYVEHYHQERPHQGLGNRLVSGEPPPNAAGELRRHTRLGGLLKHYEREAA